MGEQKNEAIYECGCWEGVSTKAQNNDKVIHSLKEMDSMFVIYIAENTWRCVMNNIKAGKVIAFILRHHPEQAAIVLDSSGWAMVNDLLAGLSAFDCSLTLEQLQKIVAEDNKGRFVFNEDGSRIRATHGHSVKVELGLKRQKPPAILYHGTAERFFPSIADKGILPCSRQQVHLSPNIELARTVGARHGSPVILQVDADAMWRDGCAFYEADGQTWLTDTVPVSYFHKIDGMQDFQGSEKKKGSFQILVDADACPVVPQVEAVARKYQVATTLLCDTNHILTSKYSAVRVISAGADAVDLALINSCRHGDIVVTQDYGVAALALGKGAYAIHQNGWQYDNENIDGLLAERHFASKARRSHQKLHLHGPAKRIQEDNDRFVLGLENLIRMLLMNAE